VIQSSPLHGITRVICNLHAVARSRLTDVGELFVIVVVIDWFRVTKVTKVEELSHDMCCIKSVSVFMRRGIIEIM